MSSFIQNLVSRHIGQANTVKPRTRGLFETVGNISASFEPQPMDISEKKDAVMISNERNVESFSRPAEVKKINHLYEKAYQKPITINPNSKDDSPQMINRPLAGELKPNKGYRLKNSPENGVNKLGLTLSNESLENTRLNKDADKKASNEALKQKSSIVQKQIIYNESRVQSPEITPVFPQNHFHKQENTWLQQLKSAAEIYLQPAAIPTIKVNIGRLEVQTAVSTPIQPLKSSPSPKPRMTLEDFLNKQNRNAR